MILCTVSIFPGWEFDIPGNVFENLHHGIRIMWSKVPTYIGMVSKIPILGQIVVVKIPILGQVKPVKPSTPNLSLPPGQNTDRCIRMVNKYKLVQSKHTHKREEGNINIFKEL